MPTRKIGAGDVAHLPATNHGIECFERLVDGGQPIKPVHVVEVNIIPLSNYGAWAVEEFETANGPTDYALCVDGRIFGIVEPKKLTLGPQSVLTQAQLRATCLSTDAHSVRESNARRIERRRKTAEHVLPCTRSFEYALANPVLCTGLIREGPC